MAITNEERAVLNEALQAVAQIGTQEALKLAQAEARITDTSEQAQRQAAAELLNGTRQTLPFLEELKAAARVAEQTGQSLASVAKQARAASLHSLGMFAAGLKTPAAEQAPESALKH